jgi:transcriptional regulator with XRE-family HTH domain
MKHESPLNEEFRKLMALACWSAAETARRLEVSESSISAYINDKQVPPPSKINHLRLLVDHAMKSNPEHEQTVTSFDEHYSERGPASPLAVAKKKSLRELRLDSLYIRIETLAGGLRTFESAEEKAEAAQELSVLAAELADKLQTPEPSKSPA